MLDTIMAVSVQKSSPSFTRFLPSVLSSQSLHPFCKCYYINPCQPYSQWGLRGGEHQNSIFLESNPFTQLQCKITSFQGMYLHLTALLVATCSAFMGAGVSAATPAGFGHKKFCPGNLLVCFSLQIFTRQYFFGISLSTTSQSLSGISQSLCLWQ